ncbi:MAG: glutamate--tRNA ligase [Gammaproteobacteria bacterium RIFCSPHIGHO2_12_FULL_42_10]|nr:MAG: glutamate--tRNA ligase [Gammaproteobacteria bacterium RIFCSPHIGHO2_12_FULL_42_10]
MVRTRFAPSPTGYLHIGGVRTALYAWLYAQKMKGQFILRIEDTDLLRSTEASVQAILDGMAWLRLNYDEGPFYQTKRFDRYHAVTQQFLDDGKAYRCYCSKERLEQLRTAQIANKEKPRYDGHCLKQTAVQSGSFVVRFKNPTEGAVVFEDLVHGPLSFENTELDDLVIARSDGVPTYNFTVVVDDWDMRITHVIRGDDHINNTPRQINILKALGVKPPQYAHVPMILGGDGKRLSKRHGAVSVLQYQEEGYLHEALLNYLVRLGWSHGDQEIFSINELIEYFDIKEINKSPAAFNQEKLLWLNQHYIKTGDVDYLASQLKWQLEKIGVVICDLPKLTDVVNAQRERAKTLHEMALKSRFFYEEPVITDAIRQQIPIEIKPFLIMVRDRLLALASWEKAAIHAVLIETAEANQLKLGKLAQPIRLLVTGGTVSPPIDLTLELIGKERVIARLG